MQYAIATLPRSGSNFLSEILAKNGLGIPQEDFNIYFPATFSLALAQGIST